MRLILDTHVLIWALAAPNRLDGASRDLIEDPRNDVMMSVASVWEIAIKQALGRADFDVPPGEIVAAADVEGIRTLPILATAALRIADLPAHHRDPFDRLLVAQAIDEDALLLTADAQLPSYGPLVRLVT